MLSDRPYRRKADRLLPPSTTASHKCGKSRCPPSRHVLLSGRSTIFHHPATPRLGVPSRRRVFLSILPVCDRSLRISLRSSEQVCDRSLHIYLRLSEIAFKT